jgi:hypothetical protein
MSPKRSRAPKASDAAAVVNKLGMGMNANVNNGNSRAAGGRGGFDAAPASLSDSLVRRASTEIPAVPSAAAAAIRRAVTELPPFTSDDPVLEQRFSRSTQRPISVRFTSELADKHGLTRWKRTALAVTGAHKLKLLAGGEEDSQLRRSDSRIAVGGAGCTS